MEELNSVLVKKDIGEETKLQCITDHPGFASICLEKWSLRMASSHYKTTTKGKYTQMESEERYTITAVLQIESRAPQQCNILPAFLLTRKPVDSLCDWDNGSYEICNVTCMDMEISTHWPHLPFSVLKLAVPKAFSLNFGKIENIKQV